MISRTLTTTIVVGAIAVASAALSAAESFGYFGAAGPTHWSALSPGWSTCGTGKVQSPVDFSLRYPVQPRPLSIEYGPTTGEILNNGHTIEVETEGRNTL